jgi:hypothetical protein
MAELEHHVVVEAVGRPWVDAFIAGVYDAFVDLRFDGGRPADGNGGPVEVLFTEGLHGAPDAHYRLTYPVDPADPSGEHGTTEIAVTSLDRAAETSLDISAEEPGGRLAMKFLLRSAAHPDAVSAAGTVQWPGRPRSLRRVSGDVQINVEGWWGRLEGHGDRDGGPPIVAKITHPLAGATVTAVPRSEEEGRWTVDIVATVHGRSWARPFVFIALPLIRKSLRTGYRLALDEFAEDWTRGAPALVREDPNKLARDCLNPGALARRFDTARRSKTGDQ